jgi:Na+/H+-dicarboxylate symporter/ABC-type amino acid transport substrate-binding protein
MAGGLAVGVFFGEHARVLDAAANAFVRLMQMAVLPYVMVSIIVGIGGLRLADLRVLGTRGGLVLALLWTVALAFAFLIPVVFPSGPRGAFFSTTLLEPPAPLDFIGLYIPTNPFAALADSVVPAVVVFSMFLGVALIGVPRRQVLLDVLAALAETLGRVMRFVVRLMPFGLFAIVASTTGALRLEQLGQLELYLAAYVVLGLLLALWVLPGLIGVLTPIPARAVFVETRDALLTAAVAADLFIVLPVLVAACRSLVARHVPADAGGDAPLLPGVIIPVSYNFPHSGKLLTVTFILFAAWFSDAAIAPSEYPQLGLTAAVTLFAHTMTAIPFLLDAFRVPADTMQLFIASSVVNSRIGSLVAAMHTTAMALITACAVAGALRWRPGAIARFVVITVVLTGVTLTATRLAAQRLLPSPGVAGDPLAAMQVERRAPSTILPAALPAEPAPLPGDRLAAIHDRKMLRVGYLPDALPFAFVNDRGDMAGFDVALMHRLAHELGVRLEFVPVSREALERRGGADALLASGACDIVIGGMAVTTTRASLMRLALYLDETAGFVVPDDARRRYETWSAIRSAGAQTILVPDLPYYVEQLRARLPEARLRTLTHVEAALKTGGVDAIAMPAERGAAWTLRYPGYAVVAPSPLLKVPLAVAVPRDEPALAGLVTTWIDLKRRDGTLDALYDTWILGRNSAAPAPRWSIIRNVLRWVP